MRVLAMLVSGLLAVGTGISTAAETTPTRYFAKVTQDDLRGWDAQSWSANARSNMKGQGSCPYGGNIPKPNSQFVEISGDDLAAYHTNVDDFLKPLHGEIGRAAATGETERLKEFVLHVAKENQMTKMKPYRPKLWEGRRVGWLKTYPKFGETSYYQAIMLLAMSQARAVLDKELTDPEKEAIRRWGKTVAASLLPQAPGPDKGRDRAATMAGALIGWGASAGDVDIFKKGVRLFEQTVNGIRKDGSDNFFVGPKMYSGLELMYQNMTYGPLVLGAHILDRNGYDAFAFRGKGGSLNDAIVFHLDQSLYPEKRKKVARKQDELFLVHRHHVTNRSLAWVEAGYASRSVDEQARKLLAEAVKRGGWAGYFAGHFGGYTTCLFNDVAARG